jgi:hypothetical protein
MAHEPGNDQRASRALQLGCAVMLLGITTSGCLVPGSSGDPPELDPQEQETQCAWTFRGAMTDSMTVACVMSSGHDGEDDSSIILLLPDLDLFSGATFSFSATISGRVATGPYAMDDGLAWAIAVSTDDQLWTIKMKDAEEPRGGGEFVVSSLREDASSTKLHGTLSATLVPTLSEAETIEVEGTF